MGLIRRNRAFLIGAAMILAAGAALFGGVVAVRVLAAAAPAAPPAPAPASYNAVSSYGLTGYAPLKVTPTAETPDFIARRLEEGRGIVLLVYVEGATADMEMLDDFHQIRSRYGADSSFMAFEAHKVTDLGDTLQQLRVSDPPILAVINGDGSVAQLYTGWIGIKVMDQVVADAVRGH